MPVSFAVCVWSYRLVPTCSVMPLREIAVDFREQSGVRQPLGLEPCHCQMRCVADAGGPEMRVSFLTFLRIQLRDRGSGHAEGLQGHKRGDVPHVGEQDAGDAEVAEESERLRTLFFDAVVPAFPDIAVRREQLVKRSDDTFIDLDHVGVVGD